MRVTTLRQRIEQVPDAWRLQYSPFRDDSKKVIYDNLLRLNLKTCSADDIAAVIGNRSWTAMDCHECKADVDWLIELGQEPDYESHTASICKTCLQKAYNLFTPNPRTE